MTTADNIPVEPSISMRLLVSFLYMLISIGGSIGLTMLLSSSACFNDGRCNHADQIMFAIVAVMDFIVIIALLILGINFKLPGAKRSS